MLGTWFYEHPNCTDSDNLFLFLLTNVLIVRFFGLKRLLNALNLNVKCKDNVSFKIQLVCHFWKNPPFFNPNSGFNDWTTSRITLMIHVRSVMQRFLLSVSPWCFSISTAVSSISLIPIKTGATASRSWERFAPAVTRFYLQRAAESGLHQQRSIWLH